MRALFTLLVALTIPVDALAQQPSREREALRRAQQQLSKVQKDNAALQRDKTELEGKLKSTQEELAKLKGVRAGMKRSEKELAAARRDKAALEEKVAASDDKHKAMVQQYRSETAALQTSLAQSRATAAQLERDSEVERAHLNASVAAVGAQLQACEERNRQLYSVTTDLIDRYKQNRGAWEKFLLSEPFTGLKSVQVENMLDDMRSRAADAKARPAPK